MSVMDDRRGSEPQPLLPWLHGARAPEVGARFPVTAVDGARSGVSYPFEYVERCGVYYRGEPWLVNGTIIVAASNFAGDATGTRIANAEGFTYTGQDAGGSNIVDVVTFTTPLGSVCVIEEVGFRCESDLGYQLVEFNLVIGGSAGIGRSGQTGRVIQGNLGRPYDRDAAIKVWKRATPGSVIRLQATNTSTESVHVVEGFIRGSLFPVEWLKDERC